MEDSILWVVTRGTFRHAVASSTKKQYVEYTNFLRNVELLAPLASYERQRIAEALEEVTFPPNHEIFKQGGLGSR